MNLTLAMPEELLARARTHAARHSTTINNLIRNYLADYVESDNQSSIADEAMEFFNSITPTLPADVRITRDEMEER